MAVAGVVSGVPAVIGSAGLDPAGLRRQDRVLGSGPLLRTLEVSVAALVVNFEVLPVFFFLD